MPRSLAHGGLRSHVLALIIAALAALAAAPALPSIAQAQVDAHVAIVGPGTRTVSGAIPFSARAPGAHVRKIVFEIDGHREWTATRRPFRYRRVGKLNTHTLRDGFHTLAVEAFYSSSSVDVARQLVQVRNAPSPGHRIRKHRRHHVPSTPPVTTPPAPPVTTPPAPPVTIPPLPPVGGPPGAAVAAFNRETYSYSSSLSISQEANRYQVLVLQSTDGPKVAALKAANPGLKIFVYQHPWFARVSDPGALGVCTSYPSDLANHPAWFLHDQNGNNVPTRSGGSYVMDIGNPSYQQACAGNTISLAKRYGFDGVYFDGIAATTRWDIPSGVSLPQYPDDPSWQQATTSFLATAIADLHAQGLQVAGNLCGTALSPGLWQHWSSMLDASEEESWTDGGLGLAQQASQWSTKLANVAWSEANGKHTLLHSYNTTETGNTYGLSSMLLVAGGLASYSTSNANYTSSESSYPEFTTAAQLGAPAGPYQVLANGVYERAFANGIVLVNPTGSSVSTLSLRGGIYSGSGLSNATSVTMSPTSGLILLKVG